MHADNEVADELPQSVVCFGHPLLDMMAEVKSSFFREYNLVSGSVTLAQESQIPLFELLIRTNKNIELVTGGASMNTSRFLIWIRPSLKVSYVGALGSDHFGQILRDSLADLNIEGLFEEHTNKPTGTCAGLVCNSERTLVANLGAAVDLTLQHILSKRVYNAIIEANLFYAEGFFMNTASSLDGLLFVATHACKFKKLFCFNLNAPYVVEKYKSQIKKLLPYVDILFGNDDDILSFASVNWPVEFVPATIAELMKKDRDGPEMQSYLNSALLHAANVPSMKASSGRLVVVTRGPLSTLVGSGDSVRSYAVPPVCRDSIVDLNGAGDAFVAGFLAQYLHFPDERLSVTMGHASAQICIRHQGARFSNPPPTLQSSSIVTKKMCKPNVQPSSMAFA